MARLFDGPGLRHAHRSRTRPPHLGKPIGKDSGIKTWEGEQWKIGGGSTWGWYSYDPELNLVYYGAGNPRPGTRCSVPGDNKWSMTIWARDPDTGKAKWLYQMTPHDEWDYDGINEMILADQNIGGKKRKALVHFDRNGFGYTLDRVTGELLVAEKYRSGGELGDQGRHGQDVQDLGRPLVVAKYSTQKNGEDVNTHDICPAALGSKDQQPASYNRGRPICSLCRPTMSAWTMSRSGELHGGPALCRRTLEMFPAGKDKGETHTGNFIAWDAKKGKIVWSNKEQFSVWGRARSSLTAA